MTKLVAPTLAALAGRDDLLVLVTTGGRPLDAIAGPIPANARLAISLPFAELMPRIDALVTNGGYGTVSMALAAGVPVVVAGVSEDKAEVAARVAWTGVGVNLASETPSPAAIRAAVDQVLGTASCRARAAAMATTFASFDASRDAFAVFDELVGR